MAAISFPNEITSKATLVDGDELLIADSENEGAARKVTVADIKSAVQVAPSYVPMPTITVPATAKSARVRPNRLYLIDGLNERNMKFTLSYKEDGVVNEYCFAFFYNGGSITFVDEMQPNEPTGIDIVYAGLDYGVTPDWEYGKYYEISIIDGRAAWCAFPVLIE